MDKLFVIVAVAATAFIAGLVCAPKPEIVRSRPAPRTEEEIQLEADIKWLRDNPEIGIRILEEQLQQALEKREATIDDCAEINDRIRRLKRQIRDAAEVSAVTTVVDIVLSDYDNDPDDSDPTPKEHHVGDDTSLAGKH